MGKGKTGPRHDASTRSPGAVAKPVLKPETSLRGGQTSPFAVAVPDYFLAALRRNEKALAAFNAFPPSHKREYVAWIAEAKREETRQRRIETALVWITEGRPRKS